MDSRLTSREAGIFYVQYSDFTNEALRPNIIKSMKDFGFVIIQNVPNVKELQA